MGKLCAFYERPVSAPSHARQYVNEAAPPTFFNLQSAYNPKWYMGFGPDTPKARKLIGLRLSREGHALALPRRMGPALSHHKLVHPEKKCDFRFASGAFTPYAPPVPKFDLFEGGSTTEATPLDESEKWAGLFDHIEANHGFEVINQHQKNAVRSDSRHRAFSSATKKRKNSNKYRISYSEKDPKPEADGDQAYLLP